MTAEPASGSATARDRTALVRTGPPPTALVVTLIPLAVAVNFVGNLAIAPLGLPIYLDTIGTFLAAVLLGPWWGALAGVLTNVLGVFPNGVTNLLFAPVNVVAALVWGYGVRRLGLGRRPGPVFPPALLPGLPAPPAGAPHR